MIRQIQKDEAGLAAEIERVCFSDAWSLEALEQSAENRFDIVYLCQDQGETVGYCLFRILAGEGELLRIAVLPQFRGKGYGRELMEAMAEAARAMEVSQIFLEVRESNEKARHLYETCGFCTVTVRKDYYGNPKENGIIMKKRMI